MSTTAHPLVEGARGRLQTAQLRSRWQASTVHNSQRRLVALVAAVDGPLELPGATRQQQLVLVPAPEGVALSVWPVDRDGDRCDVESLASGAGVVVDAIAMPAGHEPDSAAGPIAIVDRHGAHRHLTAEGSPKRQPRPGHDDKRPHEQQDAQRDDQRSASCRAKARFLSTHGAPMPRRTTYDGAP